MTWLRGFCHFWYDFIVGDDWTIAVGVVIGVALTALAARAGLAAWVVLPLVVAAMLGWSIARVRAALLAETDRPLEPRSD